MFTDGLFSFITADPGMQTQLGTSRPDNTKGVFPTLAPNQCTLPYVVFQQIGHEDVVSLSGINRLQMSTFRFSCYGTDYRKAKVLGEALKKLLDGLVVTFSDGSVIQHTVLKMQADDSEAVPHGTIFANHFDFEFVWIDNS